MQSISPNATRASGFERFELTAFFEGRTVAWGVIEDRFGRVRRRCTVEMFGRWEGEEFLIDERFAFDDGETDSRVWRVVRTGGGSFSATCPECVGTARGTCDQDTIRMAYRFRLKISGRTVDVDFDDRIYRMSEGIAVNRATMRKWGIRLGELSLFFQKEGASAAQSPRGAAA